MKANPYKKCLICDILENERKERKFCSLVIQNVLQARLRCLRFFFNSVPTLAIISLPSLVAGWLAKHDLVRIIYSQLELTKQ